MINISLTQLHQEKQRANTYGAILQTTFQLGILIFTSLQHNPTTTSSTANTKTYKVTQHVFHQVKPKIQAGQLLQ